MLVYDYRQKIYNEFFSLEKTRNQFRELLCKLNYNDLYILEYSRIIRNLQYHLDWWTLENVLGKAKKNFTVIEGWIKSFAEGKAESLPFRKVLKTTWGFYEQHVTLERWKKVYYRKKMWELANLHVPNKSPAYVRCLSGSKIQKSTVWTNLFLFRFQFTNSNPINSIRVVDITWILFSLVLKLSWKSSDRQKHKSNRWYHTTIWFQSWIN